MNTIDDASLIKKFITGQVRLAFNKNLRIEPVSTTIQLFTKKGCLLATVNAASNSKSFFVRRDTEYWQLINQILLEKSFMPVSKTQQGLFKYEQRFLPAGYGMSYTEARILWKTWRIRSNHISAQNSETEIDMKIETKEGWEKIENMEISQDNVFITTATEEVMLNVSDCLVWISPSRKKVTQEVTQEESSPGQEENQSASPQENLSNSFNDLLWNQDELEEANTTDTTVNTNSNSNSNFTSFDGKNQNILNIYQGKLYIQTVEGEVVIEGSNLKFWFSPPPGQNFVPEPIEIKDYDKPVKTKANFNNLKEEAISNV